MLRAQAPSIGLLLQLHPNNMCPNPMEYAWDMQMRLQEHLKCTFPAPLGKRTIWSCVRSSEIYTIAKSTQRIQLFYNAKLEIC